MLSFDTTNNLLMQSKYRYNLQDVAEPNLYREIYDYDHVPKVAFNLRHVPMQMPDEIWMTDTTFRDGQQSREPYTTEQIVALYDYLHRLGGPKGIIHQSDAHPAENREEHDQDRRRDDVLRRADLPLLPRVAQLLRGRHLCLFA